MLFRNKINLIFVVTFIVIIAVFACSKEESINEKREFIRAYFNKPVDESVASPNNTAHYLAESFADTLITYINKAKYTIDVAMFTAENDAITDALNEAFDRNVQIRYITSGNNQTNTALAHLNEEVSVLKGDPAQSMHNKFIIIDAGFPEAYTITSSANNADWDLILQANNMLLIKNRAIAEAFTMEFNEMWGSNQAEPNSANAKFGPNKSDNTPHYFTVANKAVEVYFHPSDSINRKIGELISTANHEVCFAQMHFWGKTIADSLLTRMEGGVNVRGVMREHMARFNTSEYHYLQPQGAQILVDTIQRGIHHKYVVIDGYHADSNPIVIAGSYNWHYSTSKFDDNIVVIHDADLANQYMQEFEARYKEAVELE